MTLRKASLVILATCLQLRRFGAELVGSISKNTVKLITGDGVELSIYVVILFSCGVVAGVIVTFILFYLQKHLHYFCFWLKTPRFIIAWQGSSPRLTSHFPQKNPNLIRSLTVRSNLNSYIISPNDQWGNWTVLFTIGALGLWSKKTKIGKRLSGALVSILIALVASNLGIISSEAPTYSVVLKFMLPLAIPLLLLRADMRQVIQSTEKLLDPHRQHPTKE